jgi:hypothetical protein
MIEDMTVRNLSPATQRSYVAAVARFSRYFGCSPDRLGLDDVRTFQVHLASQGIAWASLNQTVAALRFFYGVTLGRPEIPERIAYAREPSRLPLVLSADEVVRFLEAVPGLRNRAALTTAYAAGLRVSEVVALKIPDIDSGRMLIRVEQGKGGKDRYVMLSPQLLDILRTYWRRPRGVGDGEGGTSCTISPAGRWRGVRARRTCSSKREADPARTHRDQREVKTLPPVWPDYGRATPDLRLAKPANLRVADRPRLLSRDKVAGFNRKPWPASSESALQTTLGHLARHSLDGAIHFVCMDWRHMAELLAAGRAIYAALKNLIVWNKTNAGMGSFYRSKHELVFAFKLGTAPHVNTFELGQHGRYRTNVWDYPGVNTLRPDRLEELAMHPTVKPVAMVADAIRDCSHRGEAVLDC